MTENAVEGTRVGIGITAQDKTFSADIQIPALRNDPYYSVNFGSLIYRNIFVPVAARSKAQVYGRSPDDIVGSNPTRGMDVCLL